MENNMSFFSSEGLTSTSANYVANLAKEYAQQFEGKLSIKFLNTDVSIIGCSESSRTEVGIGKDELEELPEIIERITKANSLIAWLREAISAKEALLKSITDKSVREWCGDNGIEYPSSPESPVTLTQEYVIERANIKLRNKIFSLKTKCAVIGKFIHPNGAFSNARKALLKNAPYEVRGEGRDALVYKHTPTISIEDADNVFFGLQASHRAAQAELNSLLHDIDEGVRQANLKYQTDYEQEQRAYNAQVNEIGAKFAIWKNEESRKIADLKIAIPNSLLPIYNEVNKLGK